LQPKPLKVHAARGFRRRGGVKDIEVDVRIVAATHQDLNAAQSAGRFRQDLFHRLSAMPIRLPPLRERERDVLLLANRAVQHFSKALARKARRFVPEAEAKLPSHQCPGNVRELKNVVERAMILVGDAELVRVAHLPAEIGLARRVVVPFSPALAAAPSPASPAPVVGEENITLDDIEKACIATGLKRLDNDRSKRPSRRPSRARRSSRRSSAITSTRARRRAPEGAAAARQLPTAIQSSVCVPLILPAEELLLSASTTSNPEAVLLPTLITTSRSTTVLVSMTTGASPKGDGKLTVADAMPPRGMSKSTVAEPVTIVGLVAAPPDQCTAVSRTLHVSSGSTIRTWPAGLRQPWTMVASPP
jgi:hypothetical protein